MNWEKFGRLFGAFYFISYASGMILPRKMPADQIDHTNFIKRLFNHLLYISGGLETIANIFLMVPIFVFLLLLSGANKAIISLYICIFLSATAEVLQYFIPGRVSSFRDFLLNSSGALLAFLFYEIGANKFKSL